MGGFDATRTRRSASFQGNWCNTPEETTKGTTSLRRSTSCTRHRTWAMGTGRSKAVHSMETEPSGKNSTTASTRRPCSSKSKLISSISRLPCASALPALCSEAGEAGTETPSIGVAGAEGAWALLGVRVSVLSLSRDTSCNPGCPASLSRAAVRARSCMSSASLRSPPVSGCMPSARLCSSSASSWAAASHTRSPQSNSRALDSAGECEPPSTGEGLAERPRIDASSRILLFLSASRGKHACGPR
mmetsp:Transcript_24453/g.70167  ORF Transcript_24453/g.70167 Transcript_24453/m.70167 type:complete len:245 (+) Transcript_24453:961-1695(+)